METCAKVVIVISDRIMAKNVLFIMDVINCENGAKRTKEMRKSGEVVRLRRIYRSHRFHGLHRFLSLRLKGGSPAAKLKCHTENTEITESFACGKIMMVYSSSLG